MLVYSPLPRYTESWQMTTITRKYPDIILRLPLCKFESSFLDRAYCTLNTRILAE